MAQHTNEAQIYDAKLSPTKDELLAEHSTITTREGSYRALDRDDRVGIEVIVGTDAEGKRTQCGFAYRDRSIALDDELSPLTHSELGSRSVAPLTADPVAVREIIQLILAGGKGADFSLGEPIFQVRGTGQLSDVNVDGVEIAEHNAYTCFGTVTLDGEENRFQLRLQEEIKDQHVIDDGELALVTAGPSGDIALIRLEVWK